MPMWLFPIGFFLTIFIPGWATHTRAYTLLWVPVVFLCTWLANKPRRRGLATWSQTVFWGALVPFLIWIALIAAVFGLAYVGGAV